MVHGIDVARAILAVHEQFHIAAGSRWIVTDCRVYVFTCSRFRDTDLNNSDTIGGI